MKRTRDGHNGSMSTTSHAAAHDGLSGMAVRAARSPAQRAQAESIDTSPLIVMQRQELHGLFGNIAQLQGVEEEEPLQGRFAAAQRVEEEEPVQGRFAATLQRVEEEEPLQGTFAPAQRVEEEEPLQGKFAAQATAQLEEQPAKANDTGLPDTLKTGIESLSGISMDSVKVHYNSPQPAQLNALAYAQGTDIHVAPGQEHHLPHEAWHVVQQAQGRVQPTMQMKDGVPVNDDAGLEREADQMGEKAVQGKFAPAVAVGNRVTGRAGTTVQCMTYTCPRIPKIAGWDPYNDKWPGSQGASRLWGAYASRGSDVKGTAQTLCDDVTKLTKDLSDGQDMGHPHMVPQRMGGKGVIGNVRPWSQTFETNDWHGVLDNKIKDHFRDNVATGGNLYEDVETVDSHIYTEAWLTPLRKRYEEAADNADRAKLKLYLDKIRTVLEPVPDDAKVIASGATFQPAGITFTPPPLRMDKAKTAFNTYNGGNLDNVQQDPLNAKPTFKHVQMLCDTDNVAEIKKLSSNVGDWEPEAWNYYLDWQTIPKKKI